MTIALQWTGLHDGQGAVLRYVHDQREGTPVADLASVVPGRSAVDASRAVLASPTLAGWLLSTDDPTLAAHLVRGGAAPKRHKCVMQCDLREHPGSAPDYGPLTPTPLPEDADPRLWAGILPSWRAAFPVDHPDHFDGDDTAAIAFCLRLVDGTELGPMHRSSTLLVDADGRALAGVLVSLRPQDPPWGGAWIADIWRDPRLRGTGAGAALIERVKGMLADDRHVSLSLAVTRGNPAKGSYDRAGFRSVVESQTLLLPG